METPVESELVHAARGGDPHALGLLLGDYLPLVHQLVTTAMNGGPDVEDVVAETMASAVAELDRLDDDEGFRPWLLALTSRQIRQGFRVRERRAARTTTLDDAIGRTDPGLDFVAVTVLQLGLSGERREVVEATRWLSGADRELLALWWQEQAGVISRAELAAAAGLRPEHAAVRVQRMRAALSVARVVMRTAAGANPCPVLTEQLRGWNGVGDPRRLSRLGRHVRRCPQCLDVDARLVAPEKLLPALALLPLPAGLLDRIPDAFAAAAAAAKPAAAQSALLKPVLVTGAALAAGALSIGFAVQYLPAPELPPATVARPPVARATPSVSPPPEALAPSPSSAPTSTPVVEQFAGVAIADLYVAPGGDDSAAGTLAEPFATLAHAVAVARPGQTIAVRGGRYPVTTPVVISTDGTQQRPIRVSNYRAERPVLDGSRLDAALVTQRAAWWTVQGLELTGARREAAYLCDGCGHTTLQRLDVHDNLVTGLRLTGDGVTGNRVLDSDFSGNHDDADHGADADGVTFDHGSGTGNLIRGNRFFDNADDGFDVEEFGSAVTVEDSWAFGNGVNRWGITDFAGYGNGFRLGGGDRADHVVRNSAAWDNTGHGFTDPDREGRLTLAGNTAFRNGRNGFDVHSPSSQLASNLSLANGTEVSLTPDRQRLTGNSWQLPGWTVSRLRETDPAAAEQERPWDGALPRTDFLATGSSLGATLH